MRSRLLIVAFAVLSLSLACAPDDDDAIGETQSEVRIFAECPAGCSPLDYTYGLICKRDLGACSKMLVSCDELCSQ